MGIRSSFVSFQLAKSLYTERRQIDHHTSYVTARPKSAPIESPALLLQYYFSSWILYLTERKKRWPIIDEKLLSFLTFPVTSPYVLRGC
jgi:hypothetical protein